MAEWALAWVTMGCGWKKQRDFHFSPGLFSHRTQDK